MKKIIQLFILAFILIYAHTVFATTNVNLAWNPNSESDLAGYKIYYGNSSGNYNTNIDVGNQTSYSITPEGTGEGSLTNIGLIEGQIYYFALTAYDTSDNESGYSTEAVYTVPNIPPSNPSGTIIFTTTTIINP